MTAPERPDPARDDVYRVVALLWQLDRMLHPTLPREPGPFRVDAEPPEPLPATGTAAPPGPAAQPAEAWSSAPPRPPRRAAPPVSVPWVEPARPDPGGPSPDPILARAASTSAGERASMVVEPPVGPGPRRHPAGQAVPARLPTPDPPRPSGADRPAPVSAPGAVAPPPAPSQVTLPPPEATPIPPVPHRAPEAPMPPAQPVVPPPPAEVPPPASRSEPLPAPAPADRPDTLAARLAAHRGPAQAAAGNPALPASPGPFGEVGRPGIVDHVADAAGRGHAEPRSGTAEPGGPAQPVPTVPARVLIEPHTTIPSTEQLARAGSEASGGDPERRHGADAVPDDDDLFADLEPDDAAGDHGPGLTLRRRGREAGRLSPAQAARLEEELRRRFLDRPPGSLR